MKSLFVLIAFLAAGAGAQAETYTCYFTEPFYMVKADTDAHTLFVQETPGGYLKTISDVHFVSSGNFKITFSNGDEKLMTLQLTGQGSDGMSEFVYPFEAQFLSSPGPTNYVGGCESQTWEKFKKDL
jgi:uncharacterized membrane protein